MSTLVIFKIDTHTVSCVARSPSDALGEDKSNSPCIYLYNINHREIAYGIYNTCFRKKTEIPKL